MKILAEPDFIELIIFLCIMLAIQNKDSIASTKPKEKKSKKNIKNAVNDYADR